MMLKLPLYNQGGDRTGEVELDPAVLGKHVRPKLLKQAIVTYLGNIRQGSAATKSRGMVAGSTRKLYRQKGTGRARSGPLRTVIRRGGGVAFAKGNQNFRREMPQKMRRLARNSAILTKILAEDAVVVEELSFEKPKTRTMATMFKGMGAGGGCVLALHKRDDVVYRSGRNIPKTEIRLVSELTAYEILRRKKLVLTRSAFDALASGKVGLNPAEAQGE